MQRSLRAVRVSGFLIACAVGAGPASAGPVFMKFDGVVVPGQPGTGEIEIHSFHWGPRQTTSAGGARSRTGNQVMMDDKAGQARMQPHGGGTGKVNVHDISISKQSSGRASSDITMKGSKIGENSAGSRPGTAIGGAIGGWANDGDEAAAARRGIGANQMTMDDTAGKEKARRRTTTVDANETITIHGGRTEGDPDRPVIIGTLPNPPAAPMQYNPKELSVSKDTMGSAASAREHDKRTTWVERSAPAAKGSVWIRVATPWTACRAGTRYPGLELGDGKASYRLSDVVVTRCGADGVSLDYAKVTVRGWDPAKKEE